MGAPIITGIVAANAGLLLMARLRGAAGQLVTRASLAAIAWQATDLLVGGVAGSDTFNVDASVFDSLQQTDPRWSVDGPTRPGADGAWGYNFAAKLNNGTFPPSIPSGTGLTPAEPRRYQVDVKFTGVDGSVSYVTFQVMAWPVYF